MLARYQNRRFQCRKLRNKIMLVMSGLSVAFGLFWLCWILLTLVLKGIPSLSFDLFLAITPAPNEQGGLINAIVGSILMIAVAMLIATPASILAGTYLAEYGRYSRITVVIRFLNDILLSAPSIIIGLFVYSIYVAQVKHYSGWAGALALAIIAVPVIVRTTDSMLNLIPNNLREAAIALGCPQWRVITMICYRAAKPGIITGVLLSVARIAGETAPLIFTALSNQFMSWNMNGPMANLPVVIYQYAASPFEDWNTLAWAGATLITLFVLVLNIATRLYFQPKKV